MDYIANNPIKPDIVVYLDGDYSDHPDQMPEIVAPIINDGYDLVLGSRSLGALEKGAMMPQQIFGNWIACNLMKIMYGYRYRDLGPFRAIKFDKLTEIGMKDQTYGWTVEMQVKALKHKFNIEQVELSYRKRIGVSKVSGTIKGSIMAGYKIITTIFKYK
jgi:hypothetical protein